MLLYAIKLKMCTGFLFKIHILHRCHHIYKKGKGLNFSLNYEMWPNRKTSNKEVSSGQYCNKAK